MLDLAGTTLGCIDTANPALSPRVLVRSQTGKLNPSVALKRFAKAKSPT